MTSACCLHNYETKSYMPEFYNPQENRVSGFDMESCQTNENK
jgi:hypothetical protein